MSQLIRTMENNAVTKAIINVATAPVQGVLLYCSCTRCLEKIFPFLTKNWIKGTFYWTHCWMRMKSLLLFFNESLNQKMILVFLYKVLFSYSLKYNRHSFFIPSWENILIILRHTSTWLFSLYHSIKSAYYIWRK